ncbi:hypothetical protein FRB90_005943, partial [Tulasnella sp. 427]
QQSSDSEEDVILFHPTRRLPRTLHAVGHARTSSLPTVTGLAYDHRPGKALLELGDTSHRSSVCQGVPYHRPALQQRLGRRIWRDEQEIDAFQLVAPHPAFFNPTTEPRRSTFADTGSCDPRRYIWDQIQAEMAAREREQEAQVSAWPRPTMMEWSGSWLGQTSGAVGV